MSIDWSIQDIARLSGATSRTLRHYDAIGLLSPTRIGTNGYRYYDEHALARLQRILLLRELGLGLPAIADVLEGQTSNTDALATHLQWLQQEQQRLDRQIGAIETTIRKLKGGEQLMAEEMLDGFDHTQYKEEVEERWGKDAYAKSDAWWRGLSADDKASWKSRVEQLGSDWIAAATSGIAPDSEDAQALAKRHVEWLTSVPGTPGANKDYIIGLGEMYVADERFGANYGGQAGAEFVRDALRVYAEANL